MAHALTQRKNGFVEMAYLGDIAWHGLGNELTEDEAVNIDERALAKAGMDWKLLRSKVRYAVDRTGDESAFLEMPDQHVLFRSDSKEALGLVSASYNIVQPKEMLEFFRDIVSENGFKLNTAGTLFGGKRFWALASIGEEANVIGNDLMKGYLLITSSCDGTMATTVKPTTVRVVCNNTLGMALSTEKTASVIKVSHRTDFNHSKVKDQLGIVHGAFGSFMHATKRLAEHEISKMRAREMTARLLVESGTVTKADPETSNGFNSIMALFEGGKGNAGKTAWDWVNGVTEWVDHGQRAKSESHRIANAWYGKGDGLKTQAFERALELVK